MINFFEVTTIEALTALLSKLTQLIKQLLIWLCTNVVQLL